METIIEGTIEVAVEEEAQEEEEGIEVDRGEAHEEDTTTMDPTR